jgi:anaerobic ribonucleoside-triphosphate reductase activating protein
MRCAGCFNPGFQPFEGGEERRADEVAGWIAGDPETEGVTFSGGEPFAQAAALAEVARVVKKAGKSVVVFTGYELGEAGVQGSRVQRFKGSAVEGRLRGSAVERFSGLRIQGEEERDAPEDEAAWKLLLAECDALIAGPYRQDRPSCHPLLGSANQRIVLLTDRYRLEDFGPATGPKRAEWRVAADGRVTVTGMGIGKEKGLRGQGENGQL